MVKAWFAWRVFLFQSTPVIANGRIVYSVIYITLYGRFNPRPLLLTGESFRFLSISFTSPGFNPRPLLLTGESWGSGQRTAWSMGFNPRPLLLTGESVTLFGISHMTVGFQSTPVIANGRIFIADCFGAVSHLVSIHARYC